MRFFVSFSSDNKVYDTHTLSLTWKTFLWAVLWNIVAPTYMLYAYGLFQYHSNMMTIYSLHIVPLCNRILIYTVNQDHIACGITGSSYSIVLQDRHKARYNRIIYTAV